MAEALSTLFFTTWILLYAPSLPDVPEDVDVYGAVSPLL
jgi:hypothetical protein